MKYHCNRTNLIEDEHVEVRNSLMRLLFPDGRGGKIMPIGKLVAFCEAVSLDPLDVLHGTMILSLDWPDSDALAEFQREMVEWILANRIRSHAEADMMFAAWTASISQRVIEGEGLLKMVPGILAEGSSGGSGNAGGMPCS